MKISKLTRNLWLFAGVCFLLAFLFNMANKNLILLSALNGITCVLAFFNAYNVHKKITNNNEDNKD